MISDEEKMIRINSRQWRMVADILDRFFLFLSLIVYIVAICIFANLYQYQ